MKNISFLVLYCLFLTCTTAFAQVNRVEKGNLVIENIPDIPQDIMQRMQQYQNVRSAALQGWLPDGRGMIISTRFGETTQLHLVEAPGGARQQITFFEEPVNGASVNPVSTDFLFTPRCRRLRVLPDFSLRPGFGQISYVDGRRLAQRLCVVV